MNTVLVFLALPFHTSAQRRVPISQPLYAHCANFVRVSDYIVYDSLLSVRARGGTAENNPRYRDSVRVVPSGGPFMLVVEYENQGRIQMDTLEKRRCSGIEWDFSCLTVCHPGNDSFPDPWYDDTLTCRQFQFSTNMVLDSAFKRLCPFDTTVVYSGLEFYLFGDSGIISHLPPHFIRSEGRKRPRRISFRTPDRQREVFYSPYRISALPANQHYTVWLDFSSPIYRDVRAVRIVITDLRRINFQGRPISFATCVGVGWGNAQIILPR